MMLARAALGLVAAAVLMAGCAGAAEPAAGPLVTAPAGTVQGREADGVLVFKGIPYAAPPVGDRRWRPPAPAAPWKGIRDAGRYGPACIQPTPRGKSIYYEDVGPTSEDCLSLNVWTPSVNGKAPVIVWIHGGSLLGGTGGTDLYSGVKLARAGTVVVTINYRLGVLGYLSHPELSRESPRGVSGNYGLLDQIEALKWVKANIAAFGGDPANVTIAGESAGALSVMYLMVSPQARGLFNRAIAESAYMGNNPALKTAAHGAPAAEGVGTYLTGALNAGDIRGLRAMNAQALMDGATRAGFLPFGVVDGVILPHQLAEAFDRGDQAPVPILAGFNSGEIRAMRFLAPPPAKSAGDYEHAIRERYGDLAPAFLALYPAADQEESLQAAARDTIYGWTAERLARSQTGMGQPSFLYLFDHGYPSADQAGIRAFHASEVPFVFGTMGQGPAGWPRPPSTPGETALSDAMVNYWASFARTGRPSAPGEAGWAPYAPSGPYMVFGDRPAPATDLAPGMFALHERVMCRRRAAGQPWGWTSSLAAPVTTGPTAACP